MKIAFVVDSQTAWLNGIYYHRIHIPITGLEKRGHGVIQIVAGENTSDKLLDFPDVVVFGRTYHPNMKAPELLMQYKARGKKVVWDIDDDYWSVNPDNPSVLVSNAYKDQYEFFVKNADAITTPSKILAQKVKKLTKAPVYFCPNAINFDVYKERPKMHKELIIGYMGASSHWRDLNLVSDAILELQKKYEFAFMVYGIIGGSLESEMYNYNEFYRRNQMPEKNKYFKNALDWWTKMRMVKVYPHIPFHVPFYTPLLHPFKLSELDFDIGICPLEDNEFNRAKSNIKFYEYASVGTAVLASNVEPYKNEVNYCADNNLKDWVSKLEKLIVDTKFREELTKKQHDWVLENRNVDKVAVMWEKALQKEGGLDVKNQEGVDNLIQ
jgi:glycosyltransferase involved in cell wall biosynthesis